MPTFYRPDSQGFLTFDNLLDERFERPAKVTAHPIQNTATVTDHRQQQQLRLSVTGLITETPFEEFVGQEGFILENAIGQPEVVFAGADDNLGKRSKAAVAFWALAEPELLAYFSNRLGFVENLMVENISYAVGKAHELRFVIDCVQVEFSESETVALPPLVTRKAAPTVCPNVNTGAKATTAADPTDARDLSGTQFLTELATGRKSGESVDVLSSWFSVE